MHKGTLAGLVGVILVASATIGLIIDRIQWAGIASMAFAEPWQPMYMIGPISVISIAIGAIGMLLLGVWLGIRSTRVR